MHDNHSREHVHVTSNMLQSLQHIRFAYSQVADVNGHLLRFHGGKPVRMSVSDTLVADIVTPIELLDKLLNAHSTLSPGAEVVLSRFDHR